jgi:hypothetical protein
MQQRRYRPGDVLDDYCPRERRITDHAIVAMIDDHIKQTRCVVCDAEHEYKDGKVPPQRRKKPQAALFTQVLDGLTGPQPPARVNTLASIDDADSGESLPDDTLTDTTALPVSADLVPAPVIAAAESARETVESPVVSVAASHGANEPAERPVREEGPWRRQLIRAALPRPEGQPPPQTRPAPEFTIRQPSNARGPRHGRRRGAGGFAGQGGNGNHAPGRFGRSAQAQGHGGRRRRGRGGKKGN